MTGDGWKTVAVETLAAPTPHALATGPFGSAISSQYFRDQGVPVIRGKNLSDDVGLRLVDADWVFLSDAKATEFSRSIARRGDLVFTCWGTIGQVGLITESARFPEYVISNKQMKLTPDGSVADSLFLYYCFSSPQVVEYIQAIAIGSSVPGFNLSQLKQIQLDLPPLSEQRAIARVLGVLDDKIELNRQMNQTLEAIARELFQSWFVDFDPVAAKSEGHDPSLPPDLARLFPDSFVELERHIVPKGWTLVNIRDIADINARSLGRNDPLDMIDYIEISEVSRGEVRQVARYSRESEPSRAKRRLSHGDTVISTVRPDRGSHFLCLQPPDSLIASTGFAVISPRAVGWAFLYTALTMPQVGLELGRMADGAAYPAVRPEVIAALSVVVPDNDAVLAAFERTVRPLYERSEASRRESRVLGSLRDALLPKLISGELRVPEAERIIEERS